MSKRQAIIITSMQLIGIYLCTTAISSHIHTYFYTPQQLTASSYMINYLHTIRPVCFILFFSPLLSVRTPSWTKTVVLSFCFIGFISPYWSVVSTI